MAENKKSFVLYADLIHTVNQLPDDKAGELFKHILMYVNDEKPVTDDLIIKISFEPIKQQLKRDLLKYECKKQQWSDAGKRSAKLKALKKKEQNQRTLTTVENRSTVSTVNDNDNVNDNVNDIYLKEKENYNFANELLNDAQWVENICRINKLGFNGKTKVEKYLQIFDSKLISELDTKTNKKDYASHFSRWIQIEIKKETTLTGEKKQTGAEAFKNLVYGSATNL